MEFIQNVIKRLALNSFYIKGWFVTIVVAILAISLKENDFRIYLLALIPNLFFWWLDSYYLRQEKLFKKIYDKVRNLKHSEINFSMDTSEFENEVDTVFEIMKTNSSICLFYLPLMLVIILLIVIA